MRKQCLTILYHAIEKQRPTQCDMHIDIILNDFELAFYQ